MSPMPANQASFTFRCEHCDAELRVLSLRGREALSELFCFHVMLAAKEDDINPNAILLQRTHLRIEHSKGERSVFGIVSRFDQGLVGDTFTPYFVELVPAVWILTQKRRSRIFQKATVQTIIQQVFMEANVSSDQFRFALREPDHTEREYCVQYAETDWNFITRLMEEEGIFYFFDHVNGTDVMVMGDMPQVHRPIKGAREGGDIVRFRDPSGLVELEEYVYDFGCSERVSSDQFVLKDYDFEHPNLELIAKARDRGSKELEVYDYPGLYTDEERGMKLAMLQLQATAVRRSTRSGSSVCPRLVPGFTFMLEEYPRGSLNQEYLLTSVEHEAAQPLGQDLAGAELGYNNRFRCIPSKVPFRPMLCTPRPVVNGLQTALVVGPEGEEIWTDQYGRVKVQFFWDREGKQDEHSSCWIRCAQVSAGRGWGSMFIPRIGQEVVVSYLEGNPDRPIITGVVYNADQIPGYKLPDERTKSYIKTNSATGGDGYNEIRFEDKSGEEQVFIHAQRQMDVRVRGDRIEHVVGSRHLMVGHEKDGGKVGDKVELVHCDSHITVRRHQIERIEGNKQLLVGRGEEPDGGNLDVIVDKNRTELIGEDAHEHVIGDRREQVDGAVSCTVKGDCQQKVQQNYLLEAGAAYHLKAGTELVIEGGTIITLKGPGGFINIDPEGITIQGNVVKVNCGGSPAEGIAAAPRLPQSPMEAGPQRPQPADNSKTGRKSAPE